MKHAVFGVVELGRKLKEIRLRARLTQVEVAERMGSEGGSGMMTVWRLESGRTAKPSVKLIGLFLRACGASWSELTAVLDRAVMPRSALGSVPDIGQPEKDRAKVALAAERETAAFDLRLTSRADATPIHPDRRESVVRALRNYRVVAGVIELSVVDLLRGLPVVGTLYPNYRAVARHTLGLLWQAEKKKQALPEPAKLRAKDEDWRRQGLDMAIVGQAQEIVLRVFRQLRENNPELMPTAQTRIRCPERRGHRGQRRQD